MSNHGPTHDIYWSVGGALVSFGLLRHSTQTNLAVGAGLLILGVKLREWLAALPVGGRVTRPS
jgi:hypothetical protein